MCVCVCVCAGYEVLRTLLPYTTLLLDNVVCARVVCVCALRGVHYVASQNVCVCVRSCVRACVCVRVRAYLGDVITTDGGVTDGAMG